jgi:hemerythrin
MEKVKYFIFISGEIKSGKDTVGNYIVNTYKYKRYAFADEMKNQVSKIFKIERSLLDTHEGKNQIINSTSSVEPTQLVKNDNIRTVRDVLIEYANMKRGENINYWVEYLKDKIIQDDSSHIVITDWRFLNEYETMKKLFTNSVFITINIKRKNNINLYSTCISETSLKDFQFDHIINNDDGIQSLYRNVDLLMNRFL